MLNEVTRKVSYKNRLIYLVICFILCFSCWAAAAPTPDYSDLLPFKVILSDGEKYGYLSVSTGSWAITPRFETANSFSKETGLAAVKINGKYGFINGEGKVVIPPQFDKVGIWSEGLCRVEIDGKNGFINNTGGIVISPQPYNSTFFSEGLALTRIDGKTGFIDKSGKFVIAAKYGCFTGYFQDGLAAVQSVGRYVGFIDKTGEMVIEPHFENWECHFSEGMAAVKIGGRYGFIDRTGKVVIEPQYDFAGSFREGLAGVLLNGKIGFIDKTGKVVISLRYEYPKGWEPQIAFGSCYLFHSGVANVRWNGKYGCIDKAGNWVVQPVFDQAVSYLAKQKIVVANGCLCDVLGNKLDLYANHMLDGREYLKNKDVERAIASFQGALKLVPGDEAAKYGISQAQALTQ